MLTNIFNPSLVALMSLDIRVPKLTPSTWSNNHRQSQDEINSQPTGPRVQETQSRFQHVLKQPTSPHIQDTQRRFKSILKLNRNMNMHIPRPREIRESFQPEGTSGYLLAGWTLSSFLALIVPVSKWAAERNRYHQYYGQYNEYQQQQQQYENGNYNGNYNGNGNGNVYGGMCSWWNFKCRYRMQQYQQMYGNNNNGDQDQEQAQMRAMMPGWYFFFGGAVEDDDREREEMGLTSNESSMKFVWFCTIIMFIGLSIFGFRAMYSGKDRVGVIVALLIFGQFSLMNLLTTVQGTIETDNRFFEDSVYGWFGQWSVLVAYTDFWLMLHCFIFAGMLGILRVLDKKAQRDVVAAVGNSEDMEAGYTKQEEDSVYNERQRYNGSD